MKKEDILYKKKKTYSRRDFLSKSAAGMASIGILGASGSVLGADDKKIKKQGKKSEILYRTLGKTKIRLPIVNMGVMNADNPELVKKSYKIGVRHFDTAAHYQRGRNEEMVGKAIKELNVRDKVVIATKVFIPHQQRGMPHKQAKEFFLKTMAESLKRLQTDYVDILYVHNVGTVEYLNNPGIKEALHLLKEQKKTRFIGFTTHSNMAECLNDAAQTGFYEVILTAYNYSMGDNKELIAAMKKAASKGIGLVAMKTQCKQPWYRSQYEPTDKHTYYDGKISHTALLKWAMRHRFFATSVPGYTTFEQMEEDFSVAYGLEYTSEEKTFLEDRNVKLAMASVCQQCYCCVPTCSKGVDIPTLIRTHMYAASYGNFYQARDTLDSIPANKGLQACTSCDRCKAGCANAVNIAGRIDELKTIYA